LLKRFKRRERVRTGFECERRIANLNDVKVGDILECFNVQKPFAAAEAAAQSGVPPEKK